MERVTWDGSLETGHDSVDEQHRELISIIDEIACAAHGEAPPETVEALLIRLSDYVSTHFAEEEDLMSRYAYPADMVVAHKRQHSALSERTRQLVLAHRSGEMVNVRPLASLLHEWLTVHISGADKEFVRFVRETRSESAD